MASKDLIFRFIGIDAGAGSTMESLGGKLDTTGSKWKSYALGAGVAVAGLAAGAIHLADQWDQAHTRLEGAITNVGGNMDALGGQVSSLDSHMAKFGFTATDVESSLAPLVTATKNPTQAMQLMGLAADIARGRNIDLATATNTLVKVETGHISLLGRMGIATKDASGHTITMTQAIQRLTQLYGGDAQRFAGTFSGKLAALSAQAQDLGIKVGNALIPAVTALLSAFEHVGGAVGGVISFFENNRIAAAALAAVLGAAVVPATIALVDAMAGLAGTGIGLVLSAVATAAAPAAAAVGTLSAAMDVASADLDVLAIAAASESASMDLIIASAAAATAALDEVEAASVAADAAMSINPVMAGLVAVGAVVGGLVAIFHHAGSAAGDAKTSVQGFVQGLNIQQNSLASYKTALQGIMAKENEYHRLTAQVNRISDANSGRVPMSIQNRWNDLGDQLHTLHGAWTQISGDMHTFQSHTAQVSGVLGISKSRVIALANAAGVNLSGDVGQAVLKIDALRKSAALTHHPMAEAATALKQVGTAGQTVTTDIQQLDTAWNDLIGNFVGMKQAQLDAKNAMVTFDKALKASGNSLALTSAKGRTARGDLLSLAPAISKVVDTTYQQTGSFHKAAVAAEVWVQKLKASGAAGPIVRHIINGILSDLNGLKNKTGPAGSGASKNFTSGIASGRGPAIRAAGGVVSAAQNRFGSGNASGEGLSLAQGFAAGMSSSNAFVAVASAAAALVHYALAALHHTGKGGSPYKLFIPEGGFLAQGFALGIDKGQKHVQTSSAHLVTTAAGSVGSSSKSSSTVKTVIEAGKHVAHMLYLGFKDGWHGESSSLKSALSTPLQDALDHLQTVAQNAISKQSALLKSAQQKLKSDLQARSSAISSLKGTIAGGSDLTNLFGQDANGNPTVANIGGYLSSQVGPLRQFAHDLKWARHHGLSPVLLSQIAQLGAQQGDQILRQFMSGQASIRDADLYERQIQRFSGMAAQTAVNPAFAGKLAADRHDVRDQTHTLHRIEHHLAQMEKRAARDVAHHVTIEMKGSSVSVKNMSHQDGMALLKLLHKLERQGVK